MNDTIGEMRFTLNSPLTEEDWNKITDACFDHTDNIFFHTPDGKYVEFTKKKRGKWNIEEMNTFELSYGTTGYEPVYRCSVCERVTESYFRYEKPIMPEDADFPRFCPNCGADMRGEGDEQI